MARSERHYPPGTCPDHCAGGSQSRQMNVGEALLAQFPEKVQSQIVAHGGAKRCTYCALVYLSPGSQAGAQLGFWDSGVNGPGWS